MRFTTRLRNATRAFFRGFDAAGASGRWPASAAMPAPVSEALAARGTLAMRAAYLAENSPYGASAVAAWVDNLIADGPSLRHPDKRIVKRWNQWWSEADAEGLGDLGLVLRRAARSLVVAGESFLMFETDAEDEALRLRLIAAEQVDGSKTIPAEAGAHRIVGGVELDGRGRRRAYWIFPQPLDDPLGGVGALASERVDAEDVLHIFDPHAAGAVRGRSWLGAAATRALEVDRLEDALLAKARVSALFCAFVSGSAETDFKPDANGNGSPSLSMEPGTVRVLPADSSIVFPQVPTLNDAPAFLVSQVRSFATGCNLPYELVSGDLSMTNYSSARLGLGQFRERVKAIRRTVLTPALVRVFRRFVAMEIVAGRIAADIDALADPVFIWPTPAAVDAEKETRADLLALAGGLKSRDQIISEAGRDPEDVRAEIAADPTPAPTMRISVIAGGGPIAPQGQGGGRDGLDAA